MNKLVPITLCLIASSFVTATAFGQAAVNGKQVVSTPTTSSGGITTTAVTLSANTSTQLVGQNQNRIAIDFQCGTGGVSISMQGVTLSGASVGNGGIFLPSGTTAPYFSPPVATTGPVTAYSGTAQTCVTNEYNSQ